MTTDIQLDPTDNDLLAFGAIDDGATDEGAAHVNEIDWEENEDSGGVTLAAAPGEEDKAALQASAGPGITYDEAYDGADNVMEADELTYEEDDLGNEDPSTAVASLDAQGEGLLDTETTGGDEITYDEQDGYGNPALQIQEEPLVDYAARPDEHLADELEDAGGLDPDDEGEDYDGDPEASTDAFHAGEEAQNDAADDAAVDREDSDKSADQEGSPGSDTDNYPDISVSYRNEEFPLFHGQQNIDTQMGFFEDLGILDQTMDQLLASFREEISDDLGPQDEIVFQVDELGLEYAESTQRDHLSGVTLRQLHEIFDQLAKNQDPDASRTLYTYLSIRPGPSKRLELLIEEAFNGKGLDELIFCFHPVTSNAETRQEGAHIGRKENGEGDDEDDEDENVPDRAYDSDNGSSPRDVEGEAGNYAQGGDHSVDDEDSGAALYEEDEPQLEEDDASEPEASSHGGNQDDDPVEDDLEDDVLDDLENQAPLTSLAPAAYDEGADNDFETFQVVGAEVEARELTEQNAYQDGFQAHDLIDDEQAEGEDPGFDYIDLIDEAGEEEGEEEEDGTEDAKVKVTSHNTSATATLNGDNEITYDEGDLGLESSGNFTSQAPALPLDDATDEIDWRDAPGQGDDDLKLAPTGAGKRPREEEGDEAGWEEEQDVKRRRP